MTNTQKIQILKTLMGLAFLISLSACSTQYRDALPQVSEEELVSTFGVIAEGAQGQDAYVASMAGSSDIFGGGNNTIWHGREEPGRPAASVFSVEDMSVFGNVWSSGTPSWKVLDQVDVMFVESLNDQEQRVYSIMLMMTGVTDSGNSETIFFARSSDPGAEKFSDDKFKVQIGDLRFETRDLSDKYSDELAGSIKLDIYDSNGYLGQISTLSGYGY